jgi:ribosomal protein L29
MADKKWTEQFKELQVLDNAALDAKIASLKEEMYSIRRSRISQPETNVKATRAARKTIARILTIKRQRVIAALGAK